MTMTKKWDDPKLDAAQFAIDKFYEAQSAITAEIAKIMELRRLGTATDADNATLEKLRAEWIAFVREFGDVGQRILDGSHLPPGTVN